MQNKNDNSLVLIKCWIIYQILNNLSNFEYKFLFDNLDYLPFNLAYYKLSPPPHSPGLKKGGKMFLNHFQWPAPSEDRTHDPGLQDQCSNHWAMEAYMYCSGLNVLLCTAVYTACQSMAHCQAKIDNSYYNVY